MEELAFDPFSIKSAHDWKLIMEEFKEEVSVSTTRCDLPPPLTSYIQIPSRISRFSSKENISFIYISVNENVRNLTHF